MTKGTILIGGDAGNEIGHTLRRGLIAIGGNMGDLAGFNMLAGTILLFGETGIRHGAGMKRGTIGFFGPAPQMLPTFRRACRYSPDSLRLLAKELQRLGFANWQRLLVAGRALQRRHDRRRPRRSARARRSWSSRFSV